MTYRGYIQVADLKLFVEGDLKDIVTANRQANEINEAARTLAARAGEKHSISDVRLIVDEGLPGPNGPFHKFRLRVRDGPAGRTYTVNLGETNNQPLPLFVRKSTAEIQVYDLRERREVDRYPAFPKAMKRAKKKNPELFE